MGSKLDTITAPAFEPIATTELARHLRLDDEESPLVDEPELSQAIRSARVHLEAVTQHAVATQTLKLTLDAFPGGTGAITLPRMPVQSITSVTYIDPDGVAQTIGAADYDLVGFNVVRPAYGKSWPSTRSTPEAVTVTFVAGYADDVPEPLLAAVRIHSAHLFTYRVAPSQVPDGYAELIAQHKAWGF